MTTLVHRDAVNRESGRATLWALATVSAGPIGLLAYLLAGDDD